jgi:N-acetylglucosamine-6-sulfatase
MRRDGTVWQPGEFITDHLNKVSRAQLIDCYKAGRPGFISLWPFAPHVFSDPEPDYANVAVPWTNSDPSFNEADISDKPAWFQNRWPNQHQNYGSKIAAVNALRVRTLLSVDDALKDLINVLAYLRQLSNSVIVVTSDNGYLMGEHRLDGIKQLAYEAAQAGVWIAGGGFPAGVTSGAYAMNIDIAPTIAKAAGADAPYGFNPPWDGRKLQAVLIEPDLGHDRFLAIYVPQVNLWGATDWHPQGDGVRTWRYKYVKYADGTEELYDLFVDPYEERNAANSPAYAAIEADMVTVLGQAKACKGLSCRTSAPPHLQQ